MRALRSCSFLSLITLAITPSLFAMNLDGSGHYALRGESLVAPQASSSRGLHQAIEHSFLLDGEVRFNDKSSFFMGFTFLEDESYLGDTFTSEACQAGNNDECYPDGREPRYEPYTPRIKKAYVRYAFDYFIVEAGRRGRDWGLGLYLDSGKSPFSRQASIYDGISFDINLQKTQTMSLTFGADKISETGAIIGEGKTQANSPSNRFDDVDQLFVAIEYDDQKGKSSSQLKKQVGIYVAKLMSSGELEKGGSKTDLNILDVYLDLTYQSIQLKNEALLNFGKSADPNSIRLGGAKYNQDDEPATNTYSSNIGIASQLDWTLDHSGGLLGPAAYKRGDLIRHLWVTGFAYAPGDSDGYYSDRTKVEPGEEDAKTKALSISKRKKTARGLAFHKNYKPALLLFNGKKESTDMNVDGVFHSQRLLNTQLFYTGYRYENMQAGDFEIRLLTASLLEGMPSDVKEYYASLPKDEKKPVGFYGQDLGYELDLMFARSIESDVELGIAAGILLPGKAWQVSNEKAKLSYTVQTSLGFRF